MVLEADAFVTRAGTAIDILNFQNSNAAADANENDDDAEKSSKYSNDEHIAHLLRYKSTYARIVVDANQKFLQAASRYFDLVQSEVKQILISFAMTT